MPLMKIFLFPFLISLFIGCHQRQPKHISSLPKNTDSTQNQKIKETQYSDTQLEYFLDSIGRLPSETFMTGVSFHSDSIFKNQMALNDFLSPNDFLTLKKAVKSKSIDKVFAGKIFRNLETDSIYLKKDKLPLMFISFDQHKNDFNEFAVYIDNSNINEICNLYFFKSNALIAKHTINYRYGLSVDHFKDADGKTVVYYKENYESGSGIWWYNWYFYKYTDNKIIPILNELENSNLQYPWGLRVLRLESSILKTNPLIIKMVYSQELADTSDFRHTLVNDSTIIRYKWNESSQTLDCDYSNSKLSRAQILSWYLTDNELLFMNSFQRTLHENLNSATPIRNATLSYLNAVKNSTHNKSH